MRLSIAQIISTGGFYGAERVLLELATYLHEEGHESRVVILQSPGAAKLFREARERSLPATIIACGGILDRQSVAELRDYLAAHEVVVAHSHGYKSDLWLRGAAPPATHKVATAHGWLSTNAKLRFYEWLDKRALRSFAHVVGVSPSLLETIRQSGVKREKSSLIENGVTLSSLSATTTSGGLRREFGFAPEAKIIVRVGRLDQMKGNDLLLKALAEVVPRHAAHLLFVGEGPEQTALMQQAKDVGVHAHVTFAGFRDDVADILRAADLFVSPSLSEGLPMVLLEAMAARVPVVTTDVGAINTVIRPGENGWLIPPGNTNALADALREALNAPERGRAFAERAWQDYAANYSRAAMGAKYLQLYRNVLAGDVR